MAKSRHMSMELACDVFDIASERGISRNSVKGLSDDEAYRLLCLDKRVRESVFEEPDRGYVHKEKAKVGVNLRLLFEEQRRDVAEPARSPWAIRSSAAVTATGRREQPHEAHRAQGRPVL